MRQLILKLLLPVIFIALTCYVKAQSATAACTGSLGDPVINQNFGAGANPGSPLTAGITNMQYVTSCPNDGQYTIANNLINEPENGGAACHPNAWHDVLTDHTGNPNGYMMIVNASEQPSTFFTQTANGLCPNTKYEFSAYILNLIRAAASAANPLNPDITFSIETTDGQVLETQTTGPLAPTDKVFWYNFAIYFTTPANVTDVVVKMTNNAPGGLGNDLILDDITFRACGPVIEAGFASINGPTAQQLCEGTGGSYVIKASVISSTTPALQWQVNLDSAGWSDIAGATTNSLSLEFDATTPATYQYRLGVSNGSGISDAQCRVYSSPLTVQINPLPTVPDIPPQTVCLGHPLILTASGGATYVWTGPNLAPTTQNPLIIDSATETNAGTYTVQATSKAGCPAPPMQTIVTVIPGVTPGISNNVAVCAATPTQLNASGGLYYKWTPATGLDHDDIANPVATPTQTTTYSVKISNGGCTDSTKSVTVTVNKNPVANGGGNKTIFEGQSVTLNGTAKGDEITSTVWTPATGLSDPTSLTPVASPTQSTTYTLTVSTQNCGIATDNVYVRVYKKITIPNTFSPNNDGINDLWDINELVTYPECSVWIFNRYGQKVFQSTGYSKSWDGTYNTAPLPTGTYYYVIDLKDTQPKIAGWVMLVR